MICHPLLMNCSPSFSFIPLGHTVIMNEYFTNTICACFHFHMYTILYLWTCYQNIHTAAFCVYYMFCRVIFISARAVFIYVLFILQVLKHLWGHILMCCRLRMNEIILWILNLNYNTKKTYRHKIKQFIKVQQFHQKFSCTWWWSNKLKYVVQEMC